MRKLPSLAFITITLMLSANASHAQSFAPQVLPFIKIQPGTIALTDVKIVDGTGGAIKEHQTIVLQKDKIAAVGDAGSVSIPAGATSINCSGKTILPGMVMMHEHLFYGESAGAWYLGLSMPLSFPMLYLAGGVTTMRTAGTVEPQTDLNIKNWIGQGKMTGPDIDVTAPYIEREGFPVPEILFIHSPEEAVKLVNYWADMGCTSFKVYQDITRADLQAVVKAAHARRLKVTGHLCSLTYREAAEIGIDNLEHGFMASTDFDNSKKEDACSSNQRKSLLQLDVNSPAMKALMQLLIDKKVALTSTLPVFEPYSGREVFPGGAENAMAQPIKEAVEKGYNISVSRDSSTWVLYKKELLWEKRFVEMGGRLMAGVDPTGAGRVIPGYADRHSLELLVEAGFSFSEAVKICSMNAAVYLGREKEIGSIAVGKMADLVLVEGDPEKNIRDIRNTELVFKKGVGFDSKKLFDAVKGKVGLN